MDPQKEKIKDLIKLAKQHYRHKKYDKALGLFREAAELGDPIAQYFTGMMHDEGVGIPQDYVKAIFWYTQAAEQDCLGAPPHLRTKYAKKKGQILL